MKFYFIAGEASGDMHGANLIKALRERGHHTAFRGWGGDRMKEAGLELVKHYRDHAFMGFQEVAAHLGVILRNLRTCKTDISAWKPDAVILIDYPGFNLRIAEWAKGRGIKVFYYISPQVWAWKANRVEKIKRFVDRMFVILPFEKEFYAARRCDVDFVGHPLLDEIGRRSVSVNFREEYKFGDKPIVALLPGSRKQEIRKILPTMCRTAMRFPGYRFVVAAVNDVDKSFYDKLAGKENTSYVCGRTYDLLAHASAAIVASGTATLETAIFGVPEVVCYKGSRVSFAIGKMLVNVKFISLVNLVLGRKLVEELVQKDFTAPRLETALSALLGDPSRIAEIRSGYDELRAMLGGPGASSRTAELIMKRLAG